MNRGLHVSASYAVSLCVFMYGYSEIWIRCIYPPRSGSGERSVDGYNEAKMKRFEFTKFKTESMKPVTISVLM